MHDDGESRDDAASRVARPRSPVNVAPAMTWEADAAGRTTWMSETWGDYCGVDVAALLGDGWFATFHPEEAADGEDQWRAALRAGTGYMGRRRIRRGNDGMWRWHLVQGRPIHGADGALTGWVGSATDVHELVAAPTALHEREAMLRLFIDRAPAAIAMFDRDMRYLAASRRYLTDNRLDLDPAALPGRRHDDLFPNIPDHWREVYRRVLAGETVSAEEDMLSRADGSIDWLRWEMTPWRRDDGAIGGAMLFSEIVTARVESERALADSAAQLRLALDAASLGTWRWELEQDDQPLQWDARCRALFGVPDDAMVRLADWMATLHPDDRAAAEHGLARARDPADPQDEFGATFRIRHADGTERWLATQGRALFARAPKAPAGRRALRVIGTIRDITSSRAAVSALARDKDELERLVRERTQDLEQTRERLVHAQRMEALGRLAGGIAHDFNNVLQAVDGGAQLLERNADDPDKVRRRVRMIADAVARGAAITRRLLAFARRGDLRAEPVDAAGLLDGIREILAHTLGAAIDVRVEIAPDLPPLFADRGQIETVLINLATNARDAMPQGGALTLAARLEQASDGQMLSGSPALRPGAYVRLLVGDTGVGMPPEVIARAAEPFFTTKAQDKGTGLGLAMAKGFAEQSGGALGIDSAVGVGTTVSLWLPAAAAAAEAPAAAPAEERPEGGRHGRVLLVDDDELVRDVTAETLDLAGYAVLTANSGAAALALLEAGEWVDLVITDLSMPGMNGIAVISAAQQRQPALPAILLTGFAGNAAELAIGATLRNTILLRKPVTGDVLAERAEILLRSVGRAARR